MRKKYTQEQKYEIVERYRAGEPVSSICKDTGISKSTLYEWKKTVFSKNQKPINMTDVRILKQRCEKLEKMVEVLQLSPCSVNAPLYERYEVIKDLSETYSITLLCEALKVAKGSYYNHILRNANENTSYARKKNEITPIIEEIFNESNQIFGAAKINAILRNRGYVVAEKTVADIMHENGWFSIRGGAKKHYLQLQEKKRNILNQQFTVSKPNEVWVGDVTQFLYNDRKYFICVILDLFARKVVGYRISPSNSTQLTKGTFRAAYESRKPTNLLFHSDQGCNYTSKAYVSYLKQLGVTQSFSRAYTPYDNSVIESFFKSLKTERLYRTDFRSEREFKEAVKDYIYDYNTSRPHSKLRYKTPDEYETAYFEKLENPHKS